jgi:hypothetical protein
MAKKQDVRSLDDYRGLGVRVRKVIAYGMSTKMRTLAELLVLIEKRVAKAFAQLGD